MTDTSALLNDVNLEAVGSLANHISTVPAAAATVWEAEVTWQGAFRSEARIRNFAPMASDEPAGLGGTDTAPNPVEQLLAALGNCLAVGYAANASAAGIKIEDLRIKLKGDLDLRTFLGLAQGNAGYEAIQVAVELNSDATATQLAELHDRVVGTSPVGHTLSRAVPLRIDLA
ncbi:MAG: OsmC family protein [Acidimicrobiales bacterium]